MNIKKLAPWNWFKKEEEEARKRVPVQRAEDRWSYPQGSPITPIHQLRSEMDRLFENVFHGMGMGLSPVSSDLFTPLTTSGLLKPHVDIAASEQEYTISVEVPGVNEQDIRVEIANNTMTIRGEKRQEKEEKKKDYYRIERSYGAFQRLLSLPDDADQENIKATFKKGVLSIKIPRKPLPESAVKQIEIR
jgi:HSP20 family protein